MRARDPRLDLPDQALEEVSPPAWFSLLGTSSPLRLFPFPTQHPEELYP
jgi:hypothetical protein